MTGYELSRRWWDFAFKFPGKRTPTHAALYHWYIEWANRMNWPDEFEMAPQYAMAAIGVSSYNTYKKVFSDLCEWGFISLVRDGRNQYAPCLIALSKNDIATQSALSNYDTANNNPAGINKSGMSKNDIPRDIANGVAMSKNDIPRDAITINSKENLKLKTQNAGGFSAEDIAEFGKSTFSEKKSGQAPPPIPPAPSPKPIPIPAGKTYGDGVLQAEVLAYYRDYPDLFPLSYYVPFLRHWTGKNQKGDPALIGVEKWRQMDSWDIETRLNNWHKRELTGKPTYGNQGRQTNFIAHQRATEPQSVEDYGEF